MSDRIRTSARNQIEGTVLKVQKGAVNSEVVLQSEYGPVSIIVTNGSVESLGLSEGSKAYALIKAPWVVVSKENIKTSARNKFEGTVSKCFKGAVNSEIEITVPGAGIISAVITNQSVDNMGLKEGDKAYAHIKASHILLAVF